MDARSTENPTVVGNFPTSESCPGCWRPGLHKADGLRDNQKHPSPPPPDKRYRGAGKPSSCLSCQRTSADVRRTQSGISAFMTETPGAGKIRSLFYSAFPCAPKTAIPCVSLLLSSFSRTSRQKMGLTKHFEKPRRTFYNRGHSMAPPFSDDNGQTLGKNRKVEIINTRLFTIRPSAWPLVF